MATLRIRNVPEEMKRRIVRLAREHGHTISQEVVALIQLGLELREADAALHRIGLRSTGPGLRAAENLLPLTDDREE